jgi:hypothetical protein
MNAQRDHERYAMPSYESARTAILVALAVTIASGCRAPATDRRESGDAADEPGSALVAPLDARPAPDPDPPAPDPDLAHPTWTPPPAPPRPVTSLPRLDLDRSPLTPQPMQLTPLPDAVPVRMVIDYEFELLVDYHTELEHESTYAEVTVYPPTETRGRRYHVRLTAKWRSHNETTRVADQAEFYGFARRDTPRKVRWILTNGHAAKEGAREMLNSVTVGGPRQPFFNPLPSDKPLQVGTRDSWPNKKEPPMILTWTYLGTRESRRAGRVAEFRVRLRRDPSRSANGVSVGRSEGSGSWRRSVAPVGETDTVFAEAIYNYRSTITDPEGVEYDAEATVDWRGTLSPLPADTEMPEGLRGGGADE